jgi:hypothetical protein
MPSSSRAPEPPPREGRVRESLAPLRGDGYGPRDPELAAVRRYIERADPPTSWPSSRVASGPARADPSRGGACPLRVCP